MTSGTVRPAATIRAGAAAVRIDFVLAVVGNESGLARLKKRIIAAKASSRP